LAASSGATDELWQLAFAMGQETANVHAGNRAARATVGNDLDNRHGPWLRQAAGLQPSSLEKIKDMPVIIVQGDADTMVPVAGTRRWSDKLKALNMPYEYHEIPGGDHGSVLSSGMPDIFKFFDKHSKPEKK
jgi:alpha-beta hydrolase superfamily lysophospholipase